MEINGVSYAIDIHRDNSALPYLLMLHGFMGGSRVFRPLIDDLSQACNPVTLDLLGHGKSEKIYDPNRYNDKHQVADISGLIKQLGFNPLFIYGYSMGGRLALKAAISKPGLFKGLILESTNPGITNHVERAKRRELDKKRARDIEESFERFLNKWEKLPLFQSSDATTPKQSKRYKRIQSDQDPKALAASLLGFGSGIMDPIQNSSSSYSGPVLLLVGSDDNKYININQEMQELFTNVISRTLEASHRVHLDNPERVVQELNYFIDQNT